MAKLFKRDGGTVYYARIKAPDGSWRVVSTRCTDRRAAEAVAARLEREAQGLADAASHAATTAECASAFVESRIARGRSAGTLHFYGVKLGHAVRLLPEFIAQVRFRQIEAYRAQRLAEGAHRTTTEKELGAIRAMLWHSAKTGSYPHDPAREVPDIGDSYRPRERSTIEAARKCVLDLWTVLPMLPQPSAFTDEEAPGICLEWLVGMVSASVDLFDSGPPRIAKVVIGQRPLKTQRFTGSPSDAKAVALWLFSEQGSQP